MRYWSEILKNLSILGQLGLSFAMPLLLCLFLCYKLTVWFSLGAWIYLPGFFFGLGGSFMTAWKLYLMIMKKEKKREDPGISFNSHH